MVVAVRSSARVHQSFTVAADGSLKKTRPQRANRVQAIRAKFRFLRATMRREADRHENFFIAKNRDSESANDDSGEMQGGLMTWFARQSLNV
jgi:hypothetical protein